MTGDRLQMPDANCQMPDARCQMTDDRWQMTDERFHLKNILLIFFYFLCFFWYWCYYLHTSRDWVSPKELWYRYLKPVCASIPPCPLGHFHPFSRTFNHFHLFLLVFFKTCFTQLDTFWHVFTIFHFFSHFIPVSLIFTNFWRFSPFSPVFIGIVDTLRKQQEIQGFHWIGPMGWFSL